MKLGSVFFLGHMWGMVYHKDWGKGYKDKHVEHTVDTSGGAKSHRLVGSRIGKPCPL